MHLYFMCDYERNNSANCNYKWSLMVMVHLASRDDKIKNMYPTTSGMQYVYSCVSRKMSL